MSRRRNRRRGPPQRTAYVASGRQDTDATIAKPQDEGSSRFVDSDTDEYALNERSRAPSSFEWRDNWKFALSLLGGVILVVTAIWTARKLESGIDDVGADVTSVQQESRETRRTVEKIEVKVDQIAQDVRDLERAASTAPRTEAPPQPEQNKMNGI